MKKAQITLFIIVGLVLLLGVILGVAIYKNFLQFRPPEEQVIAEVPTELKPLLFSIEECQKSLLEEGTRELLANGGYIRPEDHGIIDLPPPGGTGTALTEGRTVAYWRYIANGEEKSKQPPLVGGSVDAVSTQLARYVDERLEACVPIDEFPQYTVTTGIPSSSIDFSGGRTRITTRWPFTVETQLGTTELPPMQAEIDAPIKHLYEAAEETIGFYRDFKTPEHVTMEWLSLYASTEEQLPPIGESLRESDAVDVWVIEETKDVLRELALLSSESLEIANSREWQFTISNESAITDLYRAGMVALNTDMTNTKYRATYPVTSGMYLAINDNIGAVMPQTIDMPSFMRLFGPPLADYSFFYDVSYPLLLRYEKNGYTFTVAYETNIEDNEPLQAGNYSEPADGNYCTRPGGATINVRTRPRVTAPLVYECGGVTCPAGEITDGSLTTQLPTCAQGELDVYAEGLFAERVPISSSEGEETSVTIDLYEPEQTQLVLMKRQLIKQRNGTYALSDNPIITDGRIVMVRQGTPFVAISDGSEPVDLVPGKYAVFAIRNKNFDPPFVLEREVVCDDDATKTMTLASCGYDEALQEEPQGELDNETKRCLAERGCVPYPEANFSSLPLAYIDLSGERAVEVPYVPERVEVSAPGFEVSDIQSWEDVGIMSAMTDHAEAIEPQDAVKLRDE